MAKRDPKNPKKPFWNPYGQGNPKPRPKRHVKRRRHSSYEPVEEDVSVSKEADGLVRLNRFIAQAGVCARREADRLIEKGEIKVNGKVVSALGTKVNPRNDTIEYKGKALNSQKLSYFLYNKPKNEITTTRDPKGRRTVLDSIAKLNKVRLVPIGRLDRQTTGLLLLTNDGKMAKKLTDPSHQTRMLYHVLCDQPVKEEDFITMLKGVKLEEGVVKVIKIAYVNDGDMDQVGVEIHSSANRVIHRMFQALGYKVMALDRVSIGHLTKKRLPRGKWRELTSEEVNFLKMM